MAAFNHISGQEPSTISFKLATVTQTRNSSIMHQEILTLGDPESSLALAAVLNAKPPSTTWALAVREVSTHSTTVNVSSLGGVVAVAQNSTTWAVQLTQYSTIVAVSSLGGVVNVQQNSTVWAVQLTQYSTIVAVSSLGGVVTVSPNAGSTWAVRPIQSSQADLRVTVYQSTAADLNVTVAGYSTIVTVSTGSIRAHQGIGNSSGADVWVVALTDSSNAIVKPADSANNAIRVNVVAGAAGGSTQVSIREMLTSSGVSVMDSTETAIRVNVVAGPGVGSTTVSVSSVSGIVTVTPNAGSTWAVRPIQSSQSDLRMTAYQSTAADLNVTVAGYSTTVNVSSVSGVVNVQQNSTTWAVQLTQYSTIVAVSSVGGIVSVRQETYVHGSAYTFSTVAGGMNMARASSATPASVGADEDAVAIWASMQGALNVIHRDSTGGLVACSTAQHTSNAIGLAVRGVIPNLLRASSTSAFAASTLFVVNTTAAGQRAHVFAYSITTTNQTPTELTFYAGSSMAWAITLAAISSAVSGVNLAVSPPAYLFRCAAASSMTFRYGGAGTTSPGWKVSIGYFMDP